ncbi:hypothetical protein ARMGADRAFT_222069 [Armillaria gallica]|uniref:F-box domain-containing protein n=1 Tax=Armillaria gallica TaxID=47427 RepID=A0A2H3E641_ARMGA|nr:hypothetical protein ARMGADRAFT_222069 [Armillaria gallica]
MQRCSARTLAPTKWKNLAECVSSEWESEDEESDLDGQDEVVAKPISMKRRRTISNTAATSKQTKAVKATETKRRRSGKTQRDLSLLPTMPLDILFTICSMLSPRDLISLSRVDENLSYSDREKCLIRLEGSERS